MAYGKYALILISMGYCCVGWAQAASDVSAMEMRRIFDTLTLPDAPTRYNSGSGLPGPDYWQNRADYVIHARIDTPTHALSGEETLTYTNNSPDSLDTLWLQLDQNIYRPHSRASFVNPERHARTTDGVTLDSVAILHEGHEIPLQPHISDTRMRLALPGAPLPHGHRLRLRIRWHYTIPGPWGGRTAVTPTEDGDIYEIAQWYPRMCVYDSHRGWDTLPYLGQEFYLEYGDFDYAVTVPWNFTVVGSGALLNPAAVLTRTERGRLAQAARSRAAVMIRTAQDVTAPDSHLAHAGEKTWHFHMENTRDVSFAASPAFMWDAARMDLPPVRPAPGMPPAPRLAMSVYPRAGRGPQAWDRSTEYVRHAIEYFSRQWFPYPWPNAINVGGHGAGMEYPGIVFDGWKDRDAALFWITTHELGHGWFPMIVGSNERRYAFMDEGFNTFIDAYASRHFNHGEYAPKQDPEFAPQTGRPADDIIPVLTDPQAPPLMTAAELVPEKYRHSVSYFKSAYGLVLLREQILGPERFDTAFRRYIQAWAYRHPTPSDFFRIMESESGEDLGWFWRGWYFENDWPDYAVSDLSYINNDAQQGTQVSIRTLGRLMLPITLRLEYDDGTHADQVIPTESWHQTDTLTVTFPGGPPVLRAVLDPDHTLPEPDRANNIRSMK
ncbi:M1 family metallopeptidase [Komagataeibacter oboediens]|uniref:M1 family metallopeptidase n=1 Tax=Komagataeibacter oboediens TaxID=65958 RepID=A0ABS5SLV6_9PROT|nr:M1 family metallopeptidase [Komagataeibacter oboediens]MBL7232521.1 M1 family metallopeptidase [Komagataeibacter oboediens]MBT0675178.1 M1 family metallopeptidase [Komagataeibacter oboediens]MBT0678789.1 M1 family metallopeptidase [Komagataeibacter oboediens]